MSRISWELVILLVASVLLNLVLLFKPAVNEITAKWFSRRWEHRDKQRDVLRELYQRVGTVSTDYTLALMNRIPVPANDPASAEARQAYQRQGDGFAAKVKETQDFFAKHELQLPDGIRVLVTRLRVTMMMPIRDVHDASAILAKTAELLPITEAIRVEVARVVPRP